MALPAAAEAHTAELTFDGVAYILSVRCTGGDALEVVAERKEDASAWAATFAAKYVEEITAKTGSFKRFPVFVKMLLSAVRQESDSVFVDLLTFADLELLRSKRASAGSGASTAAAAAGQAQQAAAPSAPPPGHNKRYLILTYAAEFDRVHYPLPLAFEEHPDPRRLQATIRQLRTQLAAAQARSTGGLGRRAGASAAASPASAAGASAAEVKQLREENAALRARVQALEAALDAATAGGGGLAADVQALAADAQETVRDLRGMRRERDALLARLQQAEAALEGERNLHRRELRRRAQATAGVEAELAAAKDQIRELRLRCRELAQEADLAQRRAQVANMSASMGRPGGSAGRLPGASGSSRGSMGGQAGGLSPAGGRFPGRDISPAPIRRAPLPGGPPRSRSADVSRPSSLPSSRPNSRPTSAGRFDPTEYVRMKREREREASRRLDDMRRSARLHSPGGSRPPSLPGSRPHSLPTSRHSTPQRSRVPSRDPSADRARQAARDRSTERGRPLGDPRERATAVRSTERLRAAVRTTTPPAPSFPPRDQRAASPGRALLEVRQRLQQYANKQPAAGDSWAGGSSVGGGLIAAVPSQQAGAPAVAAVAQRVPPTGDNYADASAEIADIDSRLQSLQAFLRSAKAGQPVAAPV
ncbi:coiled-coil domain-containing 61-like isoform X1 [Chlorella sorokiniana]|uniref:Coiled-coil domain-containing protein 61 n=1 Tax=Chlorella sorokiniana TaxID=3076 RepID=A0A2P6TPY4_CHLSO|nr:coiled-coil domain-containing 61-like isoform X1 [Chlorella sorokiniana]|eukprot:PRW56091.1 coiled-coil domain-containing 61-like isoform X1 [Chlorella sorokiniana]